MSDSLLARARGGDQQAFDELLEPFVGELHVHCYRILGSIHDADDGLQETLLAAWRGLERFEGRGSLRSWLYQIATNRCFNAIRDSRRRPQRPLPTPPFAAPEPSSRGEVSWLGPYPDARFAEIADADGGPDVRYEIRESIELAFMIALQQLSPRQRAVLVLRDVLGFSASEVATILGCSQAAVKSALARGRAALDHDERLGKQPTLPLTPAQGEVVRRFADTFEADDVAGLVALLTDDARLSMPPSPLLYRGTDAIARFLSTSALYRGHRRFHLLPTRANQQPAFGLYCDDELEPIAHPAGLIVLTLNGPKIAAITRFLDTDLTVAFKLPTTLERSAPGQL